MKNNQDVHLLFEFPNKQGIKSPVYFSNPQRVIIARSIEEVLPALEEVQMAVNMGNYAGGYVSCEAAPAFDPAYKVCGGGMMPLLWFGIFSEPLRQKEETGEQAGAYHISDWRSVTSKSEYDAAIASIKNEILNGNTYQVNYTMRLRSKFIGDDFAFYKRLSYVQNANYSAYLNIGRYRILSSSPELFFRWDGETITTRPMKGTIKRGRWLEEDREHIRLLQNSEKDRAENLMIVDLLRNDLGKIAELGSVKVTSMFEIEKYPTLFQKTSTVIAKTGKNTNLTDIFTALFPCGSITGAPKISTMSIISKLEGIPRQAYCGAIGLITPDQQAVFNVPIRTVFVDSLNCTAEYGVGGGITWDSTADGEYDEAQTKAKMLTEELPKFDLLDTLKLTDGTYHLYQRHMERLQKSAQYFEFMFPLQNIESGLRALAKQHGDGEFRINLTLSKTGDIMFTSERIIEQDRPVTAVFAKSSVSAADRFLFHHTTFKEVRINKQMESDVAHKVLFWNDKGEITEFCAGNIAVEQDGMLYTPPRGCGLLSDPMREELLSNGTISERPLNKSDIHKADNVWLINSIQGWIKIQISEDL